MSKFIVSHVEARALLPDDRFKMGGQMYRIQTVEPSQPGGTLICFYPLVGKRKISVVCVPKRTMFKVYNLQNS